MKVEFFYQLNRLDEFRAAVITEIYKDVFNAVGLSHTWYRVSERFSTLSSL